MTDLVINIKSKKQLKKEAKLKKRQEKKQERDCKKLSTQLAGCYSYNRRSLNPLQLHFTSMDEYMTQLMPHDYNKWDIFTHSDYFLNCFVDKSITYLTGDSPNIINELCEGEVYVIGGLIDHNHHK
ncbi:tRNA methyltransferase 10 homolog A-like, partial [Octopus sinensis]|uniref:tRNA (guanine(9)-N(1))-methyltransferase n=1 Tax=Octopus sinensis TaxID=2607531 RepID=A0A6P7U8K3_9MOLL